MSSCYTGLVPFPGMRMRRVLVIFLILLFPLNVAALCMTAAAVQQPASEAEHVYMADAADWDNPDIDTDEPPASADCHDSMNERIRLRFPVLPACAPSAYAPPGYLQPSFPPLKPPPLA